MNRILNFLKAWGHTPVVAPAGVEAPELHVVLGLPDGQRLWIGTLRQEGDEYVFQYSADFRRQSAVPPIEAFPDSSLSYRSRTLWPFFEVRIPPMDRADVQQLVRERHLDASDPLSLLGELARRSVTSPYDLEFRRHGATA